MGQLDYPYEPQEKTEWCWCAASASVAQFYRKDSKWTQCKIAELILNRSDCCNDGPGGAVCNEPRPLDKSLRKLNHLRNVLYGHISFEAVKKQIDQQQPIGVRISWLDQPGAGHVLVISGYDANAGTVTVEDPMFGRKQHYAYDQLVDQYIANGYWSVTYLTQTNPSDSTDPDET
jgi:Papain-like cysteine protease AvrRpt2